MTPIEKSILHQLTQKIINDIEVLNDSDLIKELDIIWGLGTGGSGRDSSGNKTAFWGKGGANPRFVFNPNGFNTHEKHPGVVILKGKKLLTMIRELTMTTKKEEEELEKKLRSDFQNYAKNGIMPKSKKNDFWTPRDVFEALDERFGPYTLDAAASEENALVEDYYDKEANSLHQEWSGRVWCNPPYVKQDDKTTLKDWVQKAYDSVANGLAELVTLLIPAYTSNYYWHDTILPEASHLVFFRARLDFGGPHIRAGGASRQASVAVVFQNAWKGVGMQVLQMSNKGEWLTEETWNRQELELRLNNGIIARGENLDNGKFLVKRGSTANLRPRPSWRESEVRSRNKLIEEGTLRERGDELVFTRDVTFNSPSMAATFVRAVQSNGKVLWKVTA